MGNLVSGNGAFPLAIGHGVHRLMVAPNFTDGEMVQQVKQSVEMVAVGMGEDHQVDGFNFLSAQQRCDDVPTDIKDTVVIETTAVDQYRKSTG